MPVAETEEDAITEVGDQNSGGDCSVRFPTHNKCFDYSLWTQSGWKTANPVGFFTVGNYLCIAVKVERGIDTANPYYFIFLHLCY